MESAFRSLMDQLETVYQQAGAQLRSLGEHRRALEEQRRRLLSQLDEPGDANPDLHRHLARIEKDLDGRREEERGFRRDAQSRINELRGQFMALQQRQRDELSASLRKAQSEADRLRDELIPEARQYLEELLSRQKSVESQSVTLANQLADLNREAPDLARYDLSE